MIKSGKRIHFIDGININELENRPYELKMTPKGELYLREAIPFKYEALHGKSADYPGLVASLVKATNKKNMGFLYEGTSGMGKTVTIRNTCLELDLPVIIIKSPFTGGSLKQVAEEVNCDVVFFFDEFEKLYKGREDEINSLLGFFDGFPHPHRVISLCSFNSTDGLSEYFFNRPGRFLLQFKYQGLSVEDAISYLEGIVEIPQEYRVRLIQFISSLFTITYDVMSTLATLIKTHGIETVVDISKHLNFEVGACDYEYQVYINGVEIAGTQSAADANSPKLWYGGYSLRFRTYHLEGERQERYENISIVDKKPAVFTPQEMLDDSAVDTQEMLRFLYHHEIKGMKETPSYHEWLENSRKQGEITSTELLNKAKFEIRVKAIKVRRNFEKYLGM